MKDKRITLFLSILSLLFATYATTEPNFSNTLFDPVDERFSIPTNRIFDIKIELKDNENNTIIVDETSPIYQDIECIADTPPEDTDRCILYQEEILNKTIDAEGRIQCTFSDMPYNKTTIEVLYQNSLLKTYVVGYTPNTWNTSHSYISVSNHGVVNSIFRATYTALDDNGNHISRDQVEQLESITHVENTGGGSFYTNMTDSFIPTITIRGTNPTIVDDHMLKLYYMENNTKVYYAETLVRPRWAEWDPAHTVFDIGTIYSNRYNGNGNVNTEIGITELRDIYGNFVEHSYVDNLHITIDNPWTGRVYYSNIFHINIDPNPIISIPRSHIHTYIDDPIYCRVTIRKTPSGTPKVFNNVPIDHIN